MADDKDSKDGKPAPAEAGKISHDARGNAVWQWGSGTMRQALDSTSKMLKRLEVPGLELLDERKPEDAPKVDPIEALKAQRAAGFDPYDGGQKSAASQQKQAPRPVAPAPRPPAARPPAARPPVAAKPVEKPVEKPSFLGRLFGKDRDR